MGRRYEPPNGGLTAENDAQFTFNGQFLYVAEWALETMDGLPAPLGCGLEPEYFSVQPNGVFVYRVWTIVYYSLMSPFPTFRISLYVRHSYLDTELLLRVTTDRS